MDTTASECLIARFIEKANIFQLNPSSVVGCVMKYVSSMVLLSKIRTPQSILSVPLTF